MPTTAQYTGSKRKAQIPGEDGSSIPTASGGTAMPRANKDDETGGLNWCFLLTRDPIEWIPI